MKGRSSWNPHVPLSKRNAEKDSKNHDESHPQPQHNQHLLQSKTKNMPQSLQVKHFTETEMQQADLELRYLRYYADQWSLIDEYFANDSDLDYSIDSFHPSDDDDEINGDESSVRMKHWLVEMLQDLYQQLKLVLRYIWHKFKSE